MSVKRQAPCGHPGEVVIGAYVRCLQGCAKDPRTTPVVQTARRGEVGHVDYCACKPCTVRRRARVVVFRTQDGKVGATVPWDGISKTVTWTSEVDGTLRHWKLLDEDGDVMVDGMCDVRAYKGDPMRMDIDTIVPVKLSVHNNVWRLAEEDMRAWRTAMDSAARAPFKDVPPKHAMSTTWDVETYKAWDKAVKGLKGKTLLPIKDVEPCPKRTWYKVADGFEVKSVRQAAMPRNFGSPKQWYKVDDGFEAKVVRQAAKPMNFSEALYSRKPIERYSLAAVAESVLSPGADDDYWRERYGILPVQVHDEIYYAEAYYAESSRKASEDLSKSVIDTVMSGSWLGEYTPYCPCGILPGQCKCRKTTG